MGKAKDTKKYLKYGLVLLLCVFLIFVAFMFLRDWERRYGLFPEVENAEEPFIFEDKEYVPKDGIETFLVMGLDKYEGTSVNDSYNNDKQADFIMLLVFDNDAKKCSAIHINRDAMVELNVLGVAGNRVGTVTKQIALAHTYGNGRDVSCRNTADAVSKLLLEKVKVNHYISLAMDAAAIMNDLVGGVEVTVTDDFSGIDDTLVKGQTVTLMGDQVLHYVRTRYGLEDSSNNARMERQQQYIKALYEKYQQCVAADDEFIVDAVLELSDYIVSDRSVTQLQTLARKFTEYEFVGINDFEGETVLGDQFMEFYVDEESVMRIVVDAFYEPKED